MKKIIFVLLMVVASWCSASAYDLLEGGIAYDYAFGEMRVVHLDSYKGDIVIPEQVKYNGAMRSVTSIDSRTFDGTAVTSVRFPSTMRYVYDLAFYSCKQLKAVYLNEGLIFMGANMFKDSSLPSIEIPSTVTKIRDHCFYNCDNLTSVVVPDNVIELGMCAFMECDKLESVKLSESLTEISYCLLRDCPSLKTVVIPDNVTKIGGSCFDGSSLQELVIGKSVNFIDDLALRFNNQPVIRMRCTIPPTASSQGLRTNTEIHVPKGSLAAYKTHSYWGRFIIIDDEPAPVAPGDVNGDGIVDISDMNALINVVLSRESADKYEGRADVTGDGVVDISDINAVINIVLGK